MVVDKEEIISFKQHFRSKTVSKVNFEAKLFFSETTEAKHFLAKRSETYEAKLFLWFRETEANRSETVSVLLSFASKRNFFNSKIGTPYP